MKPLTILSPGSLERVLPVLLEDRFQDFRVIQGPSGNLRQRIEAGTRCDLFFSAHIKHCQLLASQQLLQEVAPLGFNETVLVVTRARWQNAADLKQFLSAPETHLAMATTGMFSESEAPTPLVYQLSRYLKQPVEQLEKQIRRITGGRETPNAPADRDQYGWIMEHEPVDALFTFLSNALNTVEDNPDLDLIRLPPDLRTQGLYGVGLGIEASTRAKELFHKLQTVEASSILETFGFTQSADR